MTQQFSSPTDVLEMPVCDMDADFATQTRSGPHQLTPEMRQKHKELQMLIRSEVPIRDNLKKSDCDLLYRYLIARKWDVKAAAEAVRENNTWREKHGLNTILLEKVEDWGDMPQFMGIDRDGNPVMYNTPNTTVLVDLLKTKPKDILIRRHFIAMERARYLCKKHGADRISCVLDLTNVGMSGITQAVAFLKEMSSYDQKYYPESMRRMIVCNGGWAITGAWKGIKNFIDPRTQQKISFVSGPPSAKVLSEFIDSSQIPREYGGTGDPKQLAMDFSTLFGSALGPISPPTPASLSGLTTMSTMEASLPANLDITRQVSDTKVALDSPIRVHHSNRNSVSTRPAIPARNDEFPRMQAENGRLGQQAEDEDLSDTETFYSMPSTDDEADVQDSKSFASPGVVIHAANVLDRAIIEAEMRNMARSVNPQFHANPRSAAVESGMSAISAYSPASSVMTSSSANASAVSRLQQQPSASSTTAPRLDELPPETKMYERLRNETKGFTITLGYSDGCFTASVEGIVMGRKMEQVIMYGSSDTLMMSIQKEAGHPVHNHSMLVTPKKQVRYIIRKGRLSDELKIFDIHGDRTVTSVKDMKGKCLGEKLQRYTVSQWPVSKDPRDWHAWRKGNRGGQDFYVWKEGNQVEVAPKMQLDGNTPETIIAFVLALTTLWYTPCMAF